MTDQATNTLDTFFHPPAEVVASAHVQDYEGPYARSLEDPAGFWAERAEELEWYRKWDQVLDDSDAPFYKWFVGAQTNIVHNAIDRHLKTYRRNKLALIWEGEPGDRRTFSYFALNREVSKFANVLKSMGVKKGDIVTIYLPRIPEQVIAMLACAKIGAAHSVVYGGFSVEALAERIEDAQSRVLITADGGWLRGKIVHLKEIADEAIARQPTIETCMVVKRTGQEVYMEAGRDYWYTELMGLPIASPVCATEPMDAEDMLFILYTSGTTGHPKGVVHTHGGYMVYTYTTLKYVFDIKDEDRWWCAADPGWITGHSYIVYAPLINGATSFMYEGAPNHPYPNRWWQMIEKYGITILYTAPTAIRGLMRFGDAWPRTARSEQLAPAGHCRGADQPGGVEVVSYGHRRRTLPDHGHLVADRDRRIHDHPAADHAAQAGLGHAPLLWDRRGGGGRDGGAGGGRRGGLPGGQDPLARHAAHHLQGPGALPRAVLGASSRTCTRQGIRPASTRTAMSG